jgi:toxin-antitoxin system PIN domain toxin
LVDANLLIYAQFTVYREHARTRDWLDEQFANGTRVGLPWVSLLAFLRVTTNPRYFPSAQSIDSAWTQVRAWLDQPSAWIPQPTERHGEVLAALLIGTPAPGDLVPDAHLAALAIEHDLTICTNDRDFARFPKVRWLNPLAV